MGSQKYKTFENTEIFPKKASVGKRNWGSENLLVHSKGNYTLKKIEILAGRKGGLQYHRKKDEAAFVLSGKLLLRYCEVPGEIKKVEVGPGEWFHFPPGLVHQEEAITDVVLLEVSTPHFNDRVRVEDLFGYDSSEEGLPTTEESDIEFR